MAAIYKKLIHFNKKSEFEARLKSGDILNHSIVCIKDAKLIWTHGTYYGDLSECLKKTEQTLTEEEKKQIQENLDVFLNSDFTKSNIKSTLSISDWALAASKPSYAFSEITGKPTTLGGYGIVDAYTATTIDSKLSGYLPLSGGYISSEGWRNQLNIIRKDVGDSIVGFFSENSNNYIGAVGFSADGTPIVNIKDVGNQNIIHSGNIGSQSVSYATSADSANKLDGYNLITEVTDWNSAPNTILKSSEPNTVNAPYAGYCYGAVLRFHRSSSIFYTDLVTNIYSDLLFYRRHSDKGYGDWKQIAFTDSNVASATKLQTARTIWGQSFDGTGDVSGHMTLTTGFDVGGVNMFIVSDKVYVGSKWYNSVWKGASHSFEVGDSTQMVINSYGNVLIGTTTGIGNSQAKLQVYENSNEWGSIVYTNKSAVSSSHVGGYGMLITSANNNNSTYLLSVKYNDTYLLGGGNTALLVKDNGNVIIGTTADNGAKLQVNGSVVASGSVTAKSSSDYRLKCEFDYDVDYQERLLSLGKVCDFNYTSEAQERKFAFADNKRHTSVIWQHAKNANITGFCSIEEDGYGSVNPLSSDLMFTVVGALQTNILTSRDLLKRTETIEDKVSRLEDENRLLKIDRDRMISEIQELKQLK